MLYWIYDKRLPSVSIWEQIVPRVVLEGNPVNMLVDPAERQRAIDLIADECEYVTISNKKSVRSHLRFFVKRLPV